MYAPVSTQGRRFLNCTAFLKSIKDAPFRPIVGSIGYNSSRFLADILNPLIGKSDQFVKNSRHLAEEISSVQMEDDENPRLLRYCVIVYQYAGQKIFRGETGKSAMLSRMEVYNFVGGR